MRTNFLSLGLVVGVVVIGSVIAANGNWMDFNPTMKLFKIISVVAGFLTLPVLFVKAAGAKAYQRFFVWLTFYGVTVLFTLFILYSYLNFTTGEKRTYTANVSTVRETKVQRSGNSVFKCPHTAYWISDVSNEYVTACTSKTVFDDFSSGKKYTVRITEEVYFEGLASKFSEVSFVRKD